MEIYGVWNAAEREVPPEEITWFAAREDALSEIDRLASLPPADPEFIWGAEWCLTTAVLR
jgi:hypothetical protein